MSQGSAPRFAEGSAHPLHAGISAPSQPGLPAAAGTNPSAGQASPLLRTTHVQAAKIANNARTGSKITPDDWTTNPKVVIRYPTIKHYARNAAAQERAIRVKPDVIVSLGPKPTKLTIVEAARQTMAFLGEMHKLHSHDVLQKARAIVWNTIEKTGRPKDMHVRALCVERLRKLSTKTETNLSNTHLMLQAAERILERNVALLPNEGIRAAAGVCQLSGSPQLIALANSILGWSARKVPQLAYKQDVYRFQLDHLIDSINETDKNSATELLNQLGGSSLRRSARVRRQGTTN